MKRLRLFISSVQKEFERERAALRDYLHADPLLRRFFDVFLFEDLPASDRRTDAVYLEEVASCDLYIGLFGNEYGIENASGVSPTEQEFNHAGKLGKPSLIYVKGAKASAALSALKPMRQAIESKINDINLLPRKILAQAFGDACS